MAIDNDLAALLPEPPPPSPAQRESAIGAAMRRFDGHDDAPRTATAASRPDRSWAWLARPQFVSLATMALVVVLSSSVWHSQGERFASPAPRTAAPVDRDLPAPAQPPLAIPTGDAEDPPMIAGPEPAAPPAAPAPAIAGLEQTAAAPAPADDSIVVTGSRVQRPEFESNSPMVSVDEASLEGSSTAAQSRAAAPSEERIMGVMGGRARGSPARAAPAMREAARPDWASCTLSDPARNVSACRGLADPAERGARGRAGAQLAEGLALAWQGDPDRAITAFSRAIGTAPDLSIAYLNRGLAYQMKGDLARAEADLDRAIDADPRGPRGYYHRSQIRRARGDAAGAEADARRAAQLGAN